MMTFFLVTTDHLETRLWFRDDEDFKSGMNLVAVTAYSVGVRVLSFILMSNHVHFVLEGEEVKVLQFITEFKRAYSRYLSHKYGSRDTLRRNLPSFRDQTLLAVLPDLCQSLFRERDIHLMNREQQAVLVEEIRRRFSADVNQIARIIGIPYSEIASMMQEF